MGTNQNYYLNQNYVDFEELYQVQKRDMRSLVHSSIVAITSKNQLNQVNIGSGVLISNNLVLTSGSTIYNKSMEKKSQLQCYLLRKDWKHDIMQVEQCRTEYEGHPDQLQRFHNNYALIKIKTSRLINKQQSPSIVLPCQFCIINSQLSIYGYRSQLEIVEENSDLKITQQGRSSNDLVLNYLGQTLTFVMKNCAKFQGCPIFSNQHIVGINIDAQKKGSYKFGIGRLITSDLLSNLIKWSKEMNSNDFKTKKCRHFYSQRQSSLKMAKEYFNRANYQNEYSKKILNYNKCLHIQEDLLGKMTIEVAFTRLKIGAVYANENLFDQSIELLDESTKIFEYYGVRDYNYAVSLWHLAFSYYNTQDYESAVLGFEKPLEVWEQLKNEERIKDCSLWLAKSLRVANQMNRFNQVIERYKLDQKDI